MSWTAQDRHWWVLQEGAVLQTVQTETKWSSFSPWTTYWTPDALKKQVWPCKLALFGWVILRIRLIPIKDNSLHQMRDWFFSQHIKIRQEKQPLTGVFDKWQLIFPFFIDLLQLHHRGIYYILNCRVCLFPILN